MARGNKNSAEQLTILVVDDEQIVLDSARKLLRKDPLKVVTALSADEGLSILDRDGATVVLTDMMMPGMDGLEFTKQVKQKWPTIPVVMVTGYATISTAMQAMKIGAFDYIAKPFTKAELRGIVRRALHLVAEVEHNTPTGTAAESAVGKPADDRGKSVPNLRTLGGNCWLLVEEDGRILIGVEKAFVDAAGAVTEIDLPAVGDILSQGAVCLQIFTADLVCHTVWSPVSGEVNEVNQLVADDPTTGLQNPYDTGWLLRIKPSNFEAERKVLGL